MPTTFQLVEASFPNGEGKSTEEQLSGIYDYLFVLLEQLRYSLYNLDDSNFNQSALESFIANISTPIYAKIEDAEGTFSEISASAGELMARIENVEGNYTSLSATVNGLTARVESTEGKYTSLSATVDGLKTTVSGKVDSREAETIAQTVFDQSAEGFSLSATSGSSGTVFRLNYDGVSLASTGSVDICVDAVNVSGTLSAGNVKVDGLLEVLMGYSTWGYIGAAFGSTSASWTSDVAMADSTMGCYLIATNGGVRMSYEDEHEIWVQSDGCNASSSIRTGSDRRLKNSIRYDLADEEAFFLSLKPCAYRYNSEGEDAKMRWGFVAQDVIEGAKAAGMDAATLGAVGEYEGYYSLAYGEFTALNTHMIQKLMARVDALEQRMEGQG